MKSLIACFSFLFLLAACSSTGSSGGYVAGNGLAADQAAQGSESSCGCGGQHKHSHGDACPMAGSMQSAMGGDGTCPMHKDGCTCKGDAKKCACGGSNGCGMSGESATSGKKIPAKKKKAGS